MLMYARMVLHREEMDDLDTDLREESAHKSYSVLRSEAGMHLLHPSRGVSEHSVVAHQS